MSFYFDTSWELRATGSDSNGGGFSPQYGGSDYSQSDTPYIIYSDLVPSGLSLSSSAHPFSSDLAGNTINIGGSIFQITSVSSGVATLDRTGASGATGRLGGALATPGFVASLAGSRNTVHWKNGTYVQTSSSTNVSGGVVLAASGTNWIGYSSSRFDNGSPPTFYSTNLVTLFSTGGTTSEVVLENIRFENSGTTGSNTRAVYLLGNSHILRKVEVYKFNQAFQILATKSVFIDCKADSQGLLGFNVLSQGNFFKYCYATNTGASGFYLYDSYNVLSKCIAYLCNANNSAGSAPFWTDGINTFINCSSLGECFSHTNTLAGFVFNMPSLAINCYSEYYKYGFYFGSDSSVHKNRLLYCGSWNGSLGTVGAAGVGYDFETIGFYSFSSDPFVDRVLLDFRLTASQSGLPLLSSIDMQPQIGATEPQLAGGGGLIPVESIHTLFNFGFN